MKEHYQATVDEFEKWFPDEESCLRYLLGIRWSKGFCCPRCNSSEHWTLNCGLLQCRYCGLQTSTTSGTLQHGSHKSLRDRLRAIWWVATQTSGCSARGLQRALGLRSYQTAWKWLQTIRLAMARADQAPLKGLLEVGAAYIGDEKNKVGERHTARRVKIVVGIEFSRRSHCQTGRVRLERALGDYSSNLMRFVGGNVDYGSHVIVDGWVEERYLRGAYITCEIRLPPGGIDQGDVSLPNVGRIAGLLRGWLKRYQGALGMRHLQYYLAEFGFRYNRRHCEDVRKTFHEIVQGSLELCSERWKDWKGLED